jgi:hypothetical protein
MTKILYVPNGDYLKFYDPGSQLPNIILLEKLCEFTDTRLCSKKDILAYLNYTEDVYHGWYTVNNIEIFHKFLASEIELIYD